MYSRQAQRELRYEAGYGHLNYNHLERCPDCKKVYAGAHQCKIACLYCHDLHSKKDLIENMCPVMYPLAKMQQQKHSYKCKNCKGEGSYTEEIQKIKYETNRKYEERLKEWNESVRSQSNLELQRPQRRVLDKQQTIKEVQCSDCLGKGKIMRLITCCLQGCNKCNWDKYIVNPIWKQYRKEPVKNQAVFNCSICLMDVELQAEKYTLDCRHAFHPDCIFKWMQTKKNCPVCRRIDIYTQGIKFEPDLPEERDEVFMQSEDSIPIRIRIESDEESFTMY